MGKKHIQIVLGNTFYAIMGMLHGVIPKVLNISLTQSCTLSTYITSEFRVLRMGVRGEHKPEPDYLGDSDSSTEFSIGHRTSYSLASIIVTVAVLTFCTTA